jgi:hypothetical protein
LAWALSSGVACNPKAGLESAAGAIDPDEKSYVDGPGSRLTSGPFESVGLDFDADTGVHLLARRRDDQGQSMTIFGQDAQNGCTISPNAATWFASKPASAPIRLLPFFDSLDATGTGTLRFSSIDCVVAPYSLDDAKQPIELDLEQGFLVRQGGGLVLANPWAGTTTTLVSSFQRLIETGSLFLVWGDAQVIAFDGNATEIARFGNNVANFVEVNGSYAVEDDDGVHSLSLNRGGDGFTFKTTDTDACAMSAAADAFSDWVLVHSPCSDQHLVAERVDPLAELSRLPFATEADSRFAKVEGFSESASSLSQATAFYLTNVDPATNLGTLFVAQPDGEPLQLGTNATLLHSALFRPSPTWAGCALIDIQNGLGRLIGWNWDGTSQTLAENVDLAAVVPGILANFDGHAGDVLGLDASGSVVVEQSGSPPFDSTEGDLGSSLRLEHFDGTVGALTYAEGLGPFQAVAQRVPPDEYEFLTIVPLPGFAYLESYDEKSLTGTLSVQNTSLGATSTVAAGVSDFIATNYPLPGLLYAVPSGDNAGIWFARAK